MRETWGELSTCVILTEQVVAESVKMGKVGQREREREVFLGAKIRRLWKPFYSEQEQRRHI